MQGEEISLLLAQTRGSSRRDPSIAVNNVAMFPAFIACGVSFDASG